MLPPEVLRLIGLAGKPVVLEVHRSDIRRFADAVGDDNRFYWDDQYAAGTRFKGIIAPPDFFGWPANWVPGGPFPSSDGLFQIFMTEIGKLGYFRALNAGVETEYILPVRPGDTLVSTGKMANIEEKEGKKGGKMLLSTVEITFTNQNGQVVARQRLFGIH